MNFGIEKQYFEILNSLVIQPLKDHGAQVWIFEITSAIEDSHFPYKVDLVERSKLALSYKDQVEKDKILL